MRRFVITVLMVFGLLGHGCTQAKVKTQPTPVVHSPKPAMSPKGNPKDQTVERSVISSLPPLLKKVESTYKELEVFCMMAIPFIKRI